VTEKPDHIAIGPVTVYFPDASIAEFWFMQDLTAVLGVETNAEAETTLVAALGSSRRGLDFDSEADAVVVHAKGVAALVRVLEALNSIAVLRPLWTPDELRDATEVMRAWRRPKPLPYDLGAIVGVPLRDGTLGAGHVVAFTDGGSVRGSPLVVLLDLRAPTREELTAAVSRGDGNGVGCAVMIQSEIVSGEWPIVGTRPVDVDVGALMAREARTSSSGGLLAWFLDAFHGFRLWDEMWDPQFYELMLLPGVAPPDSRRYLRDALRQRSSLPSGECRSW
jgi:hypothetical protein